MTYECPYCFKPMPSGIPDKAVWDCCGKVGHAVASSDHDLTIRILSAARDAAEREGNEALISLTERALIEANRIANEKLR